MKAIDRPDDGSPLSTPAAGASIQQRLQAVDMSSLDRLLGIREELRRIDDYRAKAESLKSNVAEAVHVRVMDDYNKRASALDRQSAPLQAQARAEYRKLRGLMDEVGRARERARLEKEELEFRRAVGELDEPQLAERLKAPLQVLDRCHSDQQILDEQAARFVAALGPEEGSADALPAAEVQRPAPAEVQRPAPVEVRGALPDRPPAPTIPASPPRADERPGSSPAPAVAPANVKQPETAVVVPPAPPAPTEEPFSPDRTMLVPELTRVASPQEIEKAKAAAEAKRVAAVPAAALLLTDSSAAQLEYRLGEVNGIGRSDENKIQIVKPGVSRMHAVVTARSGMFVVKDLESQNGTFVNGERVTERQLADGDTIEIGTVRFVFRMPWPAAVAATGTSRPRPR
jgi:hypothetical protein